MAKRNIVFKSIYQRQANQDDWANFYEACAKQKIKPNEVFNSIIGPLAGIILAGPIIQKTFDFNLGTIPVI